MKMLQDRLLKHLAINGWCWEWIGFRDRKGYGHINIAGANTLVHRAMADIVGLPGTAPQVCHHCDNPACFNPAHLFRGTNGDNVRDCVSKGRLNPFPGTRAASLARSRLGP